MNACMWMSKAKLLARWFLAALFVWIGVQHFTDPAPFVLIMPGFIPASWHEPLVLISGFFEIAGGVGVLIPTTRRWAGWGLVALLIAIFPANINMLVNEIYLEGMPHEKWLLWARLPFQVVFAFWTLWVTGLWPRAKSGVSASAEGH
jgi:uncharacterized membrane protein